MKIHAKPQGTKTPLKQSTPTNCAITKKITQLEEKMNKFSSELANIENQLADTELYNAENKEKLTALFGSTSGCEGKH